MRPHLQRAPSRRARQDPCPRRSHPNCPERNTDPAVSSCSTHTHMEGTWGSRTGAGGQPSKGVGDVGLPVMAPPTSGPQVLAFFRFSGLLLGYAVLRLRHWWVIAVRCHFLGRSGSLVGLVPGMGWRRTHSPACFPFLLPSLEQVTTLVSSAFLIVKVILSEVSSSGFGWSGGRLA